MGLGFGRFETGFYVAMPATGKLVLMHRQAVHDWDRVTKKIEKRFCDKCGNNTLIRTSYMVDAQGQTHLFLMSNFQYSLSGTKVAVRPLLLG